MPYYTVKRSGLVRRRMPVQPLKPVLILINRPRILNQPLLFFLQKIRRLLKLKNGSSNQGYGRSPKPIDCRWR